MLEAVRPGRLGEAEWLKADNRRPPCSLVLWVVCGPTETTEASSVSAPGDHPARACDRNHVGWWPASGVATQTVHTEPIHYILSLTMSGSLDNTDTTTVTHFTNISLQFRVHFLRYDEVFSGCVQTFLPLCHVSTEGLPGAQPLHLALLAWLLVWDFPELRHFSQVFLVRTIRRSLTGERILKRPCLVRDKIKHFQEIAKIQTAFCTLRAHTTVMAAQV